MPIVNGQRVRARFTSLKLGELSAVDRPAQPGARAVIMKRDFTAEERQTAADEGWALPDGSYPIKTTADLGNAIQAYGRAKDRPEVRRHIISRARALYAMDQLPEEWNVKKIETADFVAKYICETDGAHTFSEVLSENEFSDKIWPYADALSQSIRSILGDGALSGSERDAKVTASVQEFLAQVRSITPEVAKQLSELVNKREVEMPKTVEELEKLLAAETQRAEKAETALAAALKAKQTADQTAEEMTEQCKDAKKRLAEVEKQLADATDETLKVEGEEVKKSEVGAQNFRVLKLQDRQIQTARLEKRASEELPSLTGTVAQKAALIGAIEKIDDEETRKAVGEILTAAEKMTRMGFERFGTNDPSVEPTRKAAVEGFEKRVDEVMKRDDIPRHAAMTKARTEFPEEFAKYQQAAN